MTWGPWKFTDETRRVAVREHSSGAQESHLVEVEIVAEALAKGEVAEPDPKPVEPEKTLDEKLASIGLTLAELKDAIAKTEK
jgi:hypothetical protein